MAPGGDGGRPGSLGVSVAVVKHVLQASEGREEDGRYDGQSAIEYRNANTYRGSLSMGKLDGLGKFTWKDRVSYEGQFVSNSINGVGSYTWPSGAQYTGGIKLGKRHGPGVYVHGDIMYQGGWLDGLKAGIGVLYYNRQRTYYYEGEFAGGVRCGWGRMVFPSGSAYEGQWRADKMAGFGTMQWVISGHEMSARAVGQAPPAAGGLAASANLAGGCLLPFAGDLAESVRIPRQKSFDKPVTPLAQVPEGGCGGSQFASAGPARPNPPSNAPEKSAGLDADPQDRVEKYSGAWAAGKPHGFGTYTWLVKARATRRRCGAAGVSGAVGASLARIETPLQGENVYKGHFREGRRHGRGLLALADGTLFEGFWEAGVKTGDGLLVHPSGCAEVVSLAGDVIVRKKVLVPGLTPKAEGDEVVGEGLALKDATPVTAHSMQQPLGDICHPGLHVFDLLDCAPGGEMDAFDRLKNAVRRHLPQLRALYAFFAGVSTSVPERAPAPEAGSPSKPARTDLETCWPAPQVDFGAEARRLRQAHGTSAHQTDSSSRSDNQVSTSSTLIGTSADQTGSSSNLIGASADQAGSSTYQSGAAAAAEVAGADTGGAGVEALFSVLHEQAAAAAALAAACGGRNSGGGDLAAEESADSPGKGGGDGAQAAAASASAPGPSEPAVSDAQFAALGQGGADASFFGCDAEQPATLLHLAQFWQLLKVSRVLDGYLTLHACNRIVSRCSLVHVGASDHEFVFGNTTDPPGKAYEGTRRNTPPSTRSRRVQSDANDDRTHDKRKSSTGGGAPVSITRTATLPITSEAGPPAASTRHEGGRRPSRDSAWETASGAASVRTRMKKRRTTTLSPPAPRYASALLMLRKRRVASPDEPQSPILFPAFVEALVRIAHQKAKHSPGHVYNNVAKGLSLADRYLWVFTTHLQHVVDALAHASTGDLTGLRVACDLAMPQVVPANCTHEKSKDASLAKPKDRDRLYTNNATAKSCATLPMGSNATGKSFAALPVVSNATAKSYSALPMALTASKQAPDGNKIVFSPKKLMPTAPDFDTTAYYEQTDRLRTPDASRSKGISLAEHSRRQLGKAEKPDVVLVDYSQPCGGKNAAVLTAVTVASRPVLGTPTESTLYLESTTPFNRDEASRIAESDALTGPPVVVLGFETSAVKEADAKWVAKHKKVWDDWQDAKDALEEWNLQQDREKKAKAGEYDSISSMNDAITRAQQVDAQRLLHRLDGNLPIPLHQHPGHSTNAACNLRVILRSRPVLEVLSQHHVALSRWYNAGKDAGGTFTVKSLVTMLRGMRLAEVGSKRPHTLFSPPRPAAASAITALAVEEELGRISRAQHQGTAFAAGAKGVPPTPARSPISPMVESSTYASFLERVRANVQPVVPVGEPDPSDAFAGFRLSALLRPCCWYVMGFDVDQCFGSASRSAVAEAVRLLADGAREPSVAQRALSTTSSVAFEAGDRYGATAVQREKLPPELRAALVARDAVAADPLWFTPRPGGAVDAFAARHPPWIPAVAPVPLVFHEFTACLAVVAVLAFTEGRSPLPSHPEALNCRFDLDASGKLKRLLSILSLCGDPTIFFRDSNS
ncbi:Phosphatidylinositol 4-phosphate 5-kinase 2 [Diplonema papillatum]|nr:Phosphatidylinositol 4-phosphate 5-kinase 2 [Diplonema papillatum]